MAFESQNLDIVVQDYIIFDVQVAVHRDIFL